jgi:YhhN-like protein
VAELTSNNASKILTRIYFGLALILIIAEALRNTTVLLIFKPMLIPALMALYFVTSETRNMYYFAALFFAVCSNIFFLSSAQQFLLYGIVAFMFFRILTIVVVLKLIRKLPMLPFVVACIPFIFIFSCLINLTMSTLSTSFYPAIINGILISILSGIALSNYVLDDNRTNSWLAISTLLAVVLVYLFMIQKYYFPNEVFQPISALIFACAHYAFYKFVVISEKQKPDETVTQ